MRRDTLVLVVGAGIAGLAAALSFARRGYNVRLVDRAATLEEIGAGIQVSPNALRVLDRLNLLPELRGPGVEADAVTLRNGRTGRALARVPVRGADGTPYLSIRRADLQTALANAVVCEPRIELDLGVELLDLEANGHATRVELRRASGGTVERLDAPILVAADGVRSKVGDALGHPSAIASGDVAWRLTLAARASSPSEIEAWLGASRHAVAYPVDGGRSLNLVLITPARDEDARAAFRNWDARLQTMIEAAGHMTAWPLLTADRRRRPSDPSGVLFIGDAAHAMLPYAAQGAALALEDAFVAAACLAEAPDAGSAWRRFEAERQARIERVRRRVAFHRLAYHLPFPIDFARNAVLGLRSQAALAQDLAWLYDWQPPHS